MEVVFSVDAAARPWSPEAVRGLVIIVIIVVSLIAWKAGVSISDVITLTAAAASCGAGGLAALPREAR